MTHQPHYGAPPRQNVFLPLRVCCRCLAATRSDRVRISLPSSGQSPSEEGGAAPTRRDVTLKRQSETLRRRRASWSGGVSSCFQEVSNPDEASGVPQGAVRHDCSGQTPLQQQQEIDSGGTKVSVVEPALLCVLRSSSWNAVTFSGGLSSRIFPPQSAVTSPRLAETAVWAGVLVSVTRFCGR